MQDDPAEQATRRVLTSDEADRRKAVLTRLRDELATRGIESVLAGRHTLILSGCGPWAPSGPGDPELHVLGVGGRCIVATDGQRYQFAEGSTHSADDPSGAAGYVLAARDAPRVLPQ